MNVFVTGGNGFIGANVIRKLVEGKYSVTTLVRKQSNLKFIESLSIRYCFGDLLAPETYDNEIKKCDVIFHIAAFNQFWSKDKRNYYNINVNGTKNILELAWKYKKFLIYTSTRGTLGVSNPPEFSDENTQFNFHTKNDYIMSKYIAEQNVEDYIKRGLPCIIVSPTAPIGPFDSKPTPTGRVLLDYFNGNVKYYIKGGVNFVDVEDVALGHILAFQKGKVGEKYILGNENIELYEFFKKMEFVSRISVPKIKIPYSIALSASYFFVFLSKINRHSPLATPQKVSSLFNRYSYCSSKKAIEELGFPQTPIIESIKKAHSWFRQNNYIHD